MEAEFVTFGVGPIVRPGKTYVTYSPSGNEIIVGSAQSQASVFKTAQSHRKAAEASIERHMEEITSVAANGDRFVTAGTDGLVIIYKNNEFEKILIRSAVAVRSIMFDPQGMKFVIAGDDNDIRIVLANDNSKIVNLKGHTTSLKYVEYDSTGDYIISSSCDGDVRIWSVGPNEPTPRCVKILKTVTPPSKPDHDLTAKVSWCPDKSCFAVAGKNNDIRLYTYGIWTPYSNLSNGHSKIISTFSWSPNGFYMATTSSDKLLIIWDVKNKRIVRKAILTCNITEIAWHPRENQLLFANENGEILYWDFVIPENNSNLPHPAKMRQSIQTELLEAQSQDPFELNQNSLENQSLEVTNKNSFLDIKASDNESEDQESEGNNDVDMIDAEDDFVIDDDGAGYIETIKEQQRLQDLHQQRIPQTARPVLFDPPSCFQPSETPYNKEKNNRIGPIEGERRYLCFNLVGAIYTIYHDSHSIVNTEFHDQSTNRNFHFTDYSNFSMGALAESGSIFAVESKEAPKKKKTIRINEEGEEEMEEEDDFTASILYFRPLVMTAGGDKDWTFYFPAGEDVIGIGINSVSVIAATSVGLIRIFSLSGVQRHIFSLNNIVTLSAMNDLAFIVYATGPSFTNQQNLEYMLINTDMNEVLQKDKVQMSIDSKLTWAGFSETTQVAIYDSSSVIHVLHHQRRPYQGTWIPIFDGKSHAKSLQRSERYWPVGLLRDRLMCVILRGENKYPFFPRPVISEVPLQLPLIEPKSETGKIELTYLSSLYRNLHERDETEATQHQEEYQDIFDTADIEMDKDILRLINIACKAERPSRALDLVQSLRLSESVDKAIRVATYHHLSNLSNNIMKVKEHKFMSQNRVYPTSLAESLASQPSIFESNTPSLENSLSLLEKSESDNRKRNLLYDDDVSMSSLGDNSQRKKPKPFQFSQT